MKTKNYQEYLIHSLKNPKEAAGYLNAALEDGDIDAFLLALYNVAKAQGGVEDLAKKAHKSGNPYFKNMNEILSAMGMHLAVVAG